jgi:predicted enzyme related to lactoylglutathione lyase
MILLPDGVNSDRTGGPVEETAKPSPFCHIVIPAPGLQKAKSFYEAIFGWRVQAGVPGPDYWFFESGNVGGAFQGNRKPAAGSVVLFIQVDDLEATLDRIVNHGGTVTQGRGRIGEATPGYDAYFLDPNGNEVGLYSDR